MNNSAAPAPTTEDSSAAPAPAEQPAPPPETPKPNPEDVFASKFGALSKKEREIRNKENALKERITKLEKYEQNSAKWKESPQAVLEFLEAEYGIDFTRLADAQISSFQSTQPKSPEEQLKAQVKAIEDKLAKDAADKKAAEEAAVKKAAEDEEANAAKYTGLLIEKINEAIKASPEQYELIASFGQQEAVVDTMKTYYESNGEMLDLTTACEWVETYLEQELAKTPKAAKLKKMFTTDEPKQVEAQQNEPNSLSVDRMSSSVRPAPKSSTADPLDRDQRIKALLARYDGK
jgi:hypothetical protein